MFTSAMLDLCQSRGTLLTAWQSTNQDGVCKYWTLPLWKIRHLSHDPSTIHDGGKCTGRILGGDSKYDTYSSTSIFHEQLASLCAAPTLVTENTGCVRRAKFSTLGRLLLKLFHRHVCHSSPLCLAGPPNRKSLTTLLQGIQRLTQGLRLI